MHAIGEFEGLNAGFEQRVILAAFLVTAIEFRQQVQLTALIGRRRIAVADVLDQLFDLRFSRVDVGGLIGARQERAAPVLIALRGQTVGTEHDEPRQILVFRA